MREYLTYDDVQIVPKYSEIESRANCSTKTQFTKNYKIDIPLIAAPMNTVCETELAYELYKLGGVGIIHRFCSIDEQVEMIKKFHFTLSKAGNVHNKSSIPIAAAVGVKEDDIERASRLISNGVNVLLIDVAHGHHKNVKDMIQKLRQKIADFNMGYPIDIIAGNVATTKGVFDLINWGADAIRVGIGGGSVCETRIRTAIGIPQFSAIEDALSALPLEPLIPIIADGGIRYPGDVAKALALGAHSVMLGSLFAGTDEAPGEILIAGRWPHEKTQKIYRGSASATSKMALFGQANHVEGATKIIDSKGPLRNVVDDIVDGIKSCMSYVGASNLEELSQTAEFIKITQAGLVEAHPHLLL